MADFKKAQEEALSLVAQFGYAEPPINPVRIANDLGVKVYFAQFAPEDAGISGFYDADEDAIFVNRDEFPRRQTFTVAHELGHRILHKEWAKSQEYRVLLRDDREQKKDPKEQEANAFAAHLLVPKTLLQKYRSLPPEKLSDIFLVSVPVVKNRLKFEFGG